MPTLVEEPLAPASKTLPPIEKGVPIVDFRTLRAERGVDWSEMQVGDSTLFDDGKHTGKSSLYTYAKKHGWKLTKREINETQTRIWRVK